MIKDKKITKTVNKLAEKSFKDGMLNQSKVTKFVKLLNSQSKSMAIFSLTRYLKQLRRIQKQHTLFIETVIPISLAQRNKITEKFRKKFKITKVMTNLNPEILGGLKVRIGDEIWDGSLLNKLNQVREAIVYGGSN